MIMFTSIYYNFILLICKDNSVVKFMIRLKGRRSTFFELIFPNILL